MDRQWEELKKTGVFLTELADITMVAIARGSKKDILKINTHHKADSPIYAIRAEEYEGRIRDISNQLIVDYDGSHYESLEPIGNTDSKRTGREL